VAIAPCRHSSTPSGRPPRVSPSISWLVSDSKAAWSTSPAGSAAANSDGTGCQSRAAQPVRNPPISDRVERQSSRSSPAANW
jgi:hypothetical protein